MTRERRTAARHACEAHAEVALARSTSTALAGKCTVPLKTLVPDEVADDFGRFARERGYGSTSDVLRDLVLVALYGADHLADVHAQRIRSLARNLDGIGPEGAR